MQPTERALGKIPEIATPVEEWEHDHCHDKTFRHLGFVIHSPFDIRASSFHEFGLRHASSCSPA
jgi:hypothetical protein